MWALLASVGFTDKVTGVRVYDETQQTLAACDRGAHRCWTSWAEAPEQPPPSPPAPWGCSAWLVIYSRGRWRPGADDGRPTQAPVTHIDEMRGNMTGQRSVWTSLCCPWRHFNVPRAIPEASCVLRCSAAYLICFERKGSPFAFWMALMFPSGWL